VDCNNKCNLDQFIPFHRHTKPDEQGDVLPSEEAMSFVFLGRLDRQFSASNCSLNDASSPSVVMPREIRVPLRVRLPLFQNSVIKTIDPIKCLTTQFVIRMLPVPEHLA
jgi:hypothetical protein